MSVPQGPSEPPGWSPQQPNWQPAYPPAPPGSQAPPPGQAPPFGPQGPPSGGPVPPYGPQQAPPPYGAPLPPGAYPPVPGQGRSPRRRRRIVGIILMSVALLFCGLLYLSNKLSKDTDNASVGDCVKKVSSDVTVNGRKIRGDNMKIVDCTDPTAMYQVVGKVNHVSRVSLNVDQALGGGKTRCAKYSGATASYWRGDADGKDGYLLCLKVKQR